MICPILAEAHARIQVYDWHVGKETKHVSVDGLHRAAQQLKRGPELCIGKHWASTLAIYF